MLGSFKFHLCSFNCIFDQPFWDTVSEVGQNLLTFVDRSILHYLPVYVFNSLSEANSTSKSIPSEVKARVYYKSCLNLTAINKLGAKPLMRLINQVWHGSFKTQLCFLYELMCVY